MIDMEENVDIEVDGGADGGGTEESTQDGSQTTQDSAGAEEAAGRLDYIAKDASTVWDTPMGEDKPDDPFTEQQPQPTTGPTEQTAPADEEDENE